MSTIEDFVTLVQAEKIPTAAGTTLSRRQLSSLCAQGKIEARKIGNLWLVSRTSVASYRPDEKGFAAVWKKRRAERDKPKQELKDIIARAKERPQ
ncbi:MAG: hypothetical protein LBO82_06485 [Synergistaceae bacterium]|jgi:hypothetical protein|nr:hypothetical protein [Synergistaceae bacterium]